ncbi:MAG: YceI family protein [bacterium]|jgi:polyisoprenoid-binding protein YceI|nr:YceI family protein [bacterium]
MAATDRGADVATLLREGSAHGHWQLDPAGSRADFFVKHFWGAVTVHGWFERLDGDATVTLDGDVAGRLAIDAGSLQTKNGPRDRHLRSSDFFHVERHPQVVFDLGEASPSPEGTLTVRGTLEAAGHRQPVELSVQVEDVAPDAVALRGEVTVDRTQFGMTWSPLGMASKQARLSVSLRFARAAA